MNHTYPVQQHRFILNELVIFTRKLHTSKPVGEPHLPLNIKTYKIKIQVL